MQMEKKLKYSGKCHFVYIIFLIRSTLIFCAEKNPNKTKEMSKWYTSFSKGHNVKLDFQTLLGCYGLVDLRQTTNFVYILFWFA